MRRVATYTETSPPPEGSRLSLIRFDGYRGHNKMVVCKCECGGETRTTASRFFSGRTKSCGCLIADTARVNNVKHGHSRVGKKTSEYATWLHMVRRCENPKDFNYSKYGARGIGVCQRWRESFENFLADMGPRPSGMSIDRIDNARGYEPGNCRWATPAMQTINRSITKLNWVSVALIRHMRRRGADLKDIAHAFGVSRKTAKEVATGETWREHP